VKKPKLSNQGKRVMSFNKVDGGGLRFNKGKTPYRFIPLHLLAGAARVFERVTLRRKKPYPPWNWCRCMKVSIPYECLLRHLEAWYRGEELDPETGESHLSHVLCNALILVQCAERGGQKLDDRPPKEFFN